MTAGELEILIRSYLEGQLSTDELRARRDFLLNLAAINPHRCFTAP